MRRFYIGNEYGEIFDLNVLDSAFLMNPKGLGYSIETSYTRVGSVFVPNYKRDKQAKIQGDIVNASSDPYQSIQPLISFIRKTQNAFIIYKTTAGEFYKDVDIVEFGKTEIKKGALTCPITFMSTGLWYTKTATRVNITSSASSGVRYPYKFPSAFADYANGYLDFTNDGSTPAPFTVEIYGAVANPVIRVDVNGSEVARVEIDTSISSGERIIYSSKDAELYCYKGTDSQIEGFKRNGVKDGLTNLTLGMSLTNQNFFKLPVGYSQLHITADSALTNPIFVEVFKNYRVV